MKPQALQWNGCSNRRALSILFLAAVAGCSPGYRTVGEVIFPYVDSVQAANWPLLRCLYAGPEIPGRGGTASLETFEAWARERVVESESARGRGEVNLGQDGIGMIRGFGLGGGTLLGVSRIEPKGPDLLEVETPATFRYDEIDATALPEGSVLHVAVSPVGKLAELRAVSGTGETSLEALKELRLRWTLRRIPAREGCSTKWGVESVGVVEGSAKTTRIVWKF